MPALKARATPAERLFRELGSAHVQVPAASLQRLAGQLDTDRMAALRSAAEQMSWESVV